MYRLIFIAAGAALMTAPAMANDVQAKCDAYIAENGGDPASCSCLADAAPDGSALSAGILAIDSDEAYEASDQSVKDAIAACFPES